MSANASTGLVNQAHNARVTQSKAGHQPDSWLQPSHWITPLKGLVLNVWNRYRVSQLNLVAPHLEIKSENACVSPPCSPAFLDQD